MFITRRQKCRLHIARFDVKSLLGATTGALESSVEMFRATNQTVDFITRSRCAENTGGKYRAAHREISCIFGDTEAPLLWERSASAWNGLPLISIFDNKRICREIRARARRYTDQPKREESTDREFASRITCSRTLIIERTFDED